MRVLLLDQRLVWNKYEIGFGLTGFKCLKNALCYCMQIRFFVVASDEVIPEAPPDKYFVIVPASHFKGVLQSIR